MTDEDQRVPLSGLVIGYRALHGRRLAPPVDFGCFAAPADTGVLVPLQVSDAIAPEVARAKVELNLPLLKLHAWQWRQAVSVDDYVAIVSDHPDPAEAYTPFCGFIVDPDFTFGADDEGCVLTAVSPAFRLKRDVIVYGRWMIDGNGDLRHCSGLPCAFNAGGKPNCHPDLQDVSPLGITRRPPPEWDGRTGVPVFTYDGDPNAGFWTAPQIFEYLMWLYNGFETWVRNYDLLLADYARDEMIVLATEGVSLWDALHAAADKAGYDVGEWFLNDGAGIPYSQIVIVRRHCGRAVTVRHQPVSPDGAMQNLRLEGTNLFSASIAEPTSSCVTVPIVAGGRDVYEITVDLDPVWQPDWLELPAGSRIVAPDEKGHTPAMHEEYCKRYVAGGEDFPLYADCGRLWDANTDGRYCDAPWSLAVCNVAALAGEESGTWPVMTHSPLPLLSRGGPGGAQMETFLELSWDGGAHWHGMWGYELLDDRLGVRLTMENLAGVVRPPVDADDLPDPITENLFYKLLELPCYIRMRLTVCVAGPSRNVVAPARREAAGTSFATVAWFDRQTAGQRRIRPAGARLEVAGLEADTADGTAELTDAAEAVQDACEGRLLEASLPIEWMEDARVTDVVERIAGLEYDLAVNAGKARLAPRVVGRLLNFTPETYTMALTLSTDRKAGIV